MFDEGAEPVRFGSGTVGWADVKVALAVLTIAAAAGAPAPPVIKEPFSTLPCPAKPMTTLELEGCAERRILATDKAIDARVKAVFGLLRTKAARARLVGGEKAWLAYRRAYCNSASDVYEGGSLSVVEFANCEADLNVQHLKNLRAFEEALRPH